MIQFNQLIVFNILCFTRVCQKWWIQSLVQWKPHSPGQISQSRTWADIFAFVLSGFINKQPNKQTNQQKLPKAGPELMFLNPLCYVPNKQLAARHRLRHGENLTLFWNIQFGILSDRNQSLFVEKQVFNSGVHLRRRTASSARCRRLLCHKCIYFKVGRNPLSETQGV